MTHHFFFVTDDTMKHLSNWHKYKFNLNHIIVAASTRIKLKSARKFEHIPIEFCFFSSSFFFCCDNSVVAENKKLKKTIRKKEKNMDRNKKQATKQKLYKIIVLLFSHLLKFTPIGYTHSIYVSHKWKKLRWCSNDNVFLFILLEFVNRMVHHWCFNV